MSRPGFLADIGAHPEDDAPRLVFADWLDDHGDAEQAAFIRAQVGLAGMDLGDERRPALEAEALRLLTPRRKGWAGPLRRLVKGWEFRRGLVEKVRLPARDFLAHAEELFACAPVQALHLTHYGPVADELADCPHLARIRELSLTDETFLAGSRPRYDPQTRRRRAGGDNTIGIAPLRTALSSPHLTSLRSLAAPDHRLGAAGAGMVAAHPRLEGVEALDLENNEFSEGTVATLAASPQLGSLRQLRLSACEGWRFQGGEPDNVGWVGEEVAPLSAQLEELGLARSGLYAGALPLWLSLPRRRPFRVLRLEGNPLGWRHGGADSDLTALALAGLRVLDLGSCYFRAATVEALTAKADLSGLVHLALRNNPLGKKGVEALANAPALGRLTRLDLAGASGFMGDHGYCFGDAGLQALAAGSGLPRLAALDVRRQRLTAKGISHLIHSRLEGQLTWLDLRDNPLGDQGIQELLRGAWPRLVWLDVRNTDLGNGARETLRRRFGSRVRF